MPARGIELRILKIVMSICFLLVSLILLVRILENFVFQPHPYPLGLPHTHSLGVRVIFILLILFFGVASWAAWRGRGAGWPLAASYVSLFLGIVPPLVVHTWAPKGYLGYYFRFSPWWVVGILGLIAFSQPRLSAARENIDRQPVSKPV